MNKDAAVWVQESWVNRTEGHSGGDSGVYETWATFGELGRLFLDLQHEHGRCTGKVYIDRAGGARAIGWVFEKRRKYEDVDETYLAETWITLHTQRPDRSIEYHYAEL